MKVYLDNAATTPLAPEVLEAMMPFMKDHFGNPSSSHSFGRKTKSAIESARRSIAAHLGCLPSEIYFTSGGTEADNLAMHIALRDHNCTRVITSPIEHSAVIKTAQMLADKGEIHLDLVQLNEKGHVDLDHLEKLLSSDKRKTFVSLMHGNNEIANLLPLNKVADMCLKYGALFHSDTVQTMGHYAFNLKELPIHFINAAGHKFHGPKGCGFIFIRKSIGGHADITGGGQERGMRGGTENVYGIVGIAKALDEANIHISEHQAHVSDVKQYMIKRLREDIPGVSFNGDSESPDSLYTVLNVTFPPTTNHDMFLFLLDLEGIAASGGSACSSGATKGSHVLDAIGALKDGRASIRFSFSRYTTRAEVDFAMEKIRELCSVPVHA